MKVNPERISDYEYRLPREGAMRSDGIVFASPEMMAALQDDPSLQQVRNVATLPG
ncbi:MAG TPA: RNA-splicing ligase RtcB, partial [Deltaproteobacteria bacterium]|nr:RNA-splicing ligase RtcB [Deltaproteobacteria bacterium]